jgi:hypothetical protein
MTNDEIITRVAALLEQHLNATRGALRQDGYRHDLFRLFAAAYQNSKESPSGDSITADGLLEDITERWTRDDSEQSQRKCDLLKRLCQMWAEWQFAWDNYAIQGASPET